MAATRADLTAHVGGNPSKVQAALIERAARLTLLVEMMDAQAIENGGMTERDGRSYLAWSNSLTRTLRELGLKSAAPKAPSLSDYIAAKSAAKAKAEHA